MDRSHARPFIGAAPIQHAPGALLDEEELIATEQVDFSSHLFGNSVPFFAFLVEVIQQTTLATDKREYRRMSNNH